MRWTILSIVVLICFSNQSCVEADLVVTRDMKRTADTLYRNQRDTLIAEMDSLCDLKSKNNYAHLLDSIVELRKEERSRILKNIPQ